MVATHAIRGLVLTCGMNTRSRGLTGLGIVGSTVALLANVGGAHDSLTDLWPAVAVLSPVLASGLLVVGLALVGEVAWRWYAPRRRPVRFGYLAPMIDEHLDGFHGIEGREPYRSELEHTLRTAKALAQFDVGLPNVRVDVLLLRDLAYQRDLRTAQKKYPLTDAKQDSIKALAQGLRGHAAPL